MAARLYIGSSSWAEKSLIESGRFYPPGLKDSEARLSYYAQHFNLAEVDSTYYALPSRRNTQRWAAAVPQGFRFVVKVFALFSQHPTPLAAIPKSFREQLPIDLKDKARFYYKDLPAEMGAQLWRIFLGALEPLRQAGKLGAILVDFPPWFVPSDVNRQYLAHLRHHLPDDLVIIEFRNPLWVADEAAASTFSFLRDQNFGFVCIDEPQGLKSSFPPVVAVTGQVAAVRFRGRNTELWESKSASTKERFNWWYSKEELSQWLPRIHQLADRAQEVYISFTTKAQNQSVVNAQTLQHLLGLE